MEREKNQQSFKPQESNRHSSEGYERRDPGFVYKDYDRGANQAESQRASDHVETVSSFEETAETESHRS